MRISDWSSDVCSSDLARRTTGGGLRSHERHQHLLDARAGARTRPLLPGVRQQDPLLLRGGGIRRRRRSEEHTSELQSLMRISYAVLCLKKKKRKHTMCNSTLPKNK